MYTNYADLFVATIIIVSYLFALIIIRSVTCYRSRTRDRSQRAGVSFPHTANIRHQHCTMFYTAYRWMHTSSNIQQRRTSQQRGIRPRVVVAGNFNVKIGSCRTRSSLAAPNSTDLKFPRFDAMITLQNIWRQLPWLICLLPEDSERANWIFDVVHGRRHH